MNIKIIFNWNYISKDLSLDGIRELKHIIMLTNENIKHKKSF